MKKILLLFCILLSAEFGQAQQMKRLLLFAEDSSTAELQQQLQLLRSDSAGIVQHNIWIAVFASSRKMRRMFEYYKIGSAEFTLLIAGLGGVELYRSEEVLKPEEIYRILEQIDAAERSPEPNKEKGHSP